MDGRLSPSASLLGAPYGANKIEFVHTAYQNMSMLVKIVVMMVTMKKVWWRSLCKSGWRRTNSPLLSCHLLLKLSNSDSVLESWIIKT